jgi:peroxiredoxin
VTGPATARRVAAAALVAVLAACGGEGKSVVPTVGKPAPEYAATTLEGAPASLAGLRGRPVLLNVWATWCHPCREELPDLERLHQTLSPRGLAVVGVSIDDSGTGAAEVRDFARRYGVTYPLWRDPDQQVMSTFRAVGVPGTYLIGADGTLLWKHVGPVKADDPELGRVLEAALAGKRS